MRGQRLHVGGLEAAVAARRPERPDPAAVRPLPQCVGVYVQSLSGFLQAQPVFPGPDPGHDGQSNENQEDYRVGLRFTYISTEEKTGPQR